MATAPTLSQYLDNHPIADADTERLLARAAAEVLAGDGRSPTTEERVQYDPWTSRVETPLFDLADEPLEPADVEELEQSARNVIYAVCQVLARADGVPDAVQQKSLARLQAILAVDALDAELLEHAASRHVLETAATQPVEIDPAWDDDDPTLEDQATARRHREFREERRGRLRARHSPRSHTGVHGPRPIGVFGSNASPGIEKG